MAEFIIFIALLAVIFGVSFTTALAGFIKWAAIAIGVLLAIGAIIKLLETKKGAWFVLLASVLVLCLGVRLLIDDSSYNNSLRVCSSVGSVKCLISANELREHNERLGWAYSIIGSILIISSCVKLATLEDVGGPEAGNPNRKAH